MPLFMTVVQSLRPTPQWEQMRNETIAKLMGISNQMGEVARQETAKRSAIQSSSSQEIMSSIGQHPVGGSDRSHRNTVNMIHELQDYNDPRTGAVVSLPDNYKHVFSNGMDEYVLTQDEFFNPEGKIQGDWTRIQKVP